MELSIEGHGSGGLIQALNVAGWSGCSHDGDCGYFRGMTSNGQYLWKDRLEEEDVEVNVIVVDHTSDKWFMLFGVFASPEFFEPQVPDVRCNNWGMIESVQFPTSSYCILDLRENPLDHKYEIFVTKAG